MTIHPSFVGLFIWGGLLVGILFAWWRNWPDHVAEASARKAPRSLFVYMAIYGFLVLLMFAGIIGALGISN